MKILVPTDMSDNSRSGLLFAAEIARKCHAQIIILHVTDIVRNRGWNEITEEQWRLEAREEKKNELENFVLTTLSLTNILSVTYTCVLYDNYGLINSIVRYAVDNKCDYICMATRGAGTLDKWLGTNTSTLIEESVIPVFCIPSQYQPVLPEAMVYATDMADYANELAIVRSFSERLGAKLTTVHITKEEENYTYHEIEKNVQVLVQQRNEDISFKEQLGNILKACNASLLVMFNDKTKGFFESMFTQGRSKDFSFSTEVPMLIYYRNSKP